MDVLDDDLLSFWSTLNQFGVKFIMVGGFATRFHGYNRNTDDVDIWIQDTPQNRINLRGAFSHLGYGDFPAIENMEFIPGWTTFYAAGVELDILTEMKGLKHLTFEECYKMSPVAVLNGIEVRFLHINHLIENKKVVNRPKDQLDVVYLEKIRLLLNQRAKG